jgi:predicted dehydrogenase
MRRRVFLATAVAASTFSAHGFAEAAKAKRRVAVIGHTGRGNYGHGLDRVWMEFPETQICGVADANLGGLEATLKKLNVDNGYTDYRKMLLDVRPEFVTVSPRHPDQHHHGISRD